MIITAIVCKQNLQIMYVAMFKIIFNELISNYIHPSPHSLPFLPLPLSLFLSFSDNLLCKNNFKIYKDSNFNLIVTLSNSTFL